MRIGSVSGLAVLRVAAVVLVYALAGVEVASGQTSAAPSEAQQVRGSHAGVQSRVVATERMQMELVPQRLSIQAGGEFWVALRMRTSPDWYTHWRFC